MNSGRRWDQVGSGWSGVSKTAQGGVQSDGSAGGLGVLTESVQTGAGEVIYKVAALTAGLFLLATLL